MDRTANRNRPSIRRLIALASLAGVIGFGVAGGTAQADPPWQHDGGPGGGPGGPGPHGRPDWQHHDWQHHDWHHHDDDWQGGYQGPRGYYPPPPPVYYAPPPPPPPPVYYAPPPPAYYGPPSLSFGINLPLNQ